MNLGPPVPLKLLPPLALSATWFHPHVPRAIKLGLTEGEAAIHDFTMPFHTELVKELKPGFSWHAGYAQITTARALTAGSRRHGRGAEE